MILLYERGSVVLATHDDTQVVAASAYGDSVRIVPAVGLDPVPVVGESLPDPLPQATLLAYAADQRWRRQQGSIDVNGKQLATNDVAQIRLNALKQAFDSGNLTTVQFKLGDEFVTADLGMINTYHEAMTAHIQKLFAQEDTAQLAIRGGSATTLDDVDAIFAT